MSICAVDVGLTLISVDNQCVCDDLLTHCDPVHFRSIREGVVPV
jgi:hypothetical protein